MNTYNKSTMYKRRPKVTQERPDGSSDGLYEALDMPTTEEGYKGCSNRERFDQIWSLEDLFPNLEEPTAEELIEAFYNSNKSLE